MKLLSALAVGILLAGPVSAQDLAKGIATYKAGDYATALQELRPLAEQGDLWSQVGLADMYLRGNGVPQNYVEAEKWQRLAAEQGRARSQNSLGVMYERGDGVLQDYAEAIHWYRLAAEQDNAEAQSNLGAMYSKGQGVPQDYVAAVDLYRRSAEQGYGVAQSNLGFMYFKGRGVPQDNVTSHMWSNIAAASGDEKGQKNRELIAEKMTPAEISEAQRRARVCMASNYQDCD